MTVPIPLSTEVGSLGIPHIKRLWASLASMKSGTRFDRSDEIELGVQVLNAVGIGLHQALEYLFQTSPTFEQFEGWIVKTAGPS